MIVYGIKNCDTVKKAVQWLKDKNVSFEFYDYKTRGIDAQKLEAWCAQVGWEQLLNKKGTTWRQLDDSVKAAITDQKSAIGLMKQQTSIIRRPLIEQESKVLLIGFDAEAYAQKLT